LRVKANVGERIEIGGRPRRLGRFADEARFFKAWVEKPVQTGAVSPSGRFLARMMARYADPAARGPVIELGPGTGPVTQALIKRGIAQERLILVEYDAEFCRLLARRFPQARVIQGDAYDLPGALAGVLTEPAACVVSSLPLLMKQEPQRVALLRDAFALMAPGGRFVQFTYGMVSPIPRRPKDAMRVPFIADASPAVWLNLPPARVFAYQAATEASVRKLRAQRTLIGKVMEGADRVREEWRERTVRVQSEIRLATARVRHDLGARRATAKHGMIPPALAILDRIGEARRAPKR
jgi:phosphatidylethanolamine/phosphatidyl-N-methylethanolamine N-methyltransferase